MNQNYNKFSIMLEKEQEAWDKIELAIKNLDETIIYANYINKLYCEKMARIHQYKGENDK